MNSLLSAVSSVLILVLNVMLNLYYEMLLKKMGDAPLFAEHNQLSKRNLRLPIGFKLAGSDFGEAVAAF
jgi:hypothetical protein